MAHGRGSRFARISVLASASALVAATLGATAGVSSAQARAHQASGGCQLGQDNKVKHVIYVQFDNTHFRRDLPNVPSDLEQMPHLLNFMKDNGSLLTNDHTVLISHTAGGILSSLTGVYPDRHGQVVSNSNVRFNGAGFQFPSSFGYWTDPVTATAPDVPNMVTPAGLNAPAPWVPFTRAGCDFGAVAAANTVLENTGTGPSGDITKVFGNPSEQASEAIASAAAPPNTAARARAQTDFVGLAVHCAQTSTVCANGRPDALPAEPGGYTGYKGLFGAQTINPLLSGGSAVNDFNGNPIVDPFNQPGFPGFDGMSADVSLSYTAALQEKGVPVTAAYISDAHDFHGVAGNDHQAFGPGSAGYVAQLRSYDDAFAAFFARLAAHGINKSNTLFTFTVDEGDHFVGSAPNNPGCDGVTTPCDWTGHVGEINANIQTLMAHQHPEIPITTTSKFTVHGDDAPTFYLSNNPAQNDPNTRAFERAASTLTAVNPYSGNTDKLMVQMADRAEAKLLHMYTAGDPLRNPTFTFFADPNYFITDFPSSTCETCTQPAFAWNHGDIQPEIANTWLGFVGPGIRPLGQTGKVWTDHADVRPTLLTLLGLTDSYAGDGRAIVEVLRSKALPSTLRAHQEALLRLGSAYKQLNAPFGSLSLDSLQVSTAAITSGSAGSDSRYAATQARLANWLSRRDALAGQISGLLTAAESGSHAISEKQAERLADQARALIEEVHKAAR